MTAMEFDFSDDPNPYREAIPMRSRADAPECNPASERTRAEEVPRVGRKFWYGVGSGLVIIIPLWIAAIVAAYWVFH